MNMKNIEQTAPIKIDLENNRPSSQELVDILLKAEKQAHKNKLKYDFQQLIGNWRLCFITGTRNSRQILGNFIKDGFYVPSFINIYLSYSLTENSENTLEANKNIGTIQNNVSLGLVKFSLTGPAKFISKKNIMAFDFTRLTLSILGKKIYSTDVRGGKSSEEKFYQESVSKQAFFAYFLVQENLVAARGRGGGLALWKKP